MKLINFDNFSPFKKIWEKMEIEEGYKPDFQSSKVMMDEIKWKEIQTRGLDISIDELEVANDFTLEHKDFPGQKMIVYIRDYIGGYKREDSLPKFHISWCKTLEDMHVKGRYSRYVVSQRTDGKFMLNKTVNGEVVDKDIIKELNVCKNCLNKLNYKNYNKNYGTREQIVNDFNVKEFLKLYNTEIHVTPVHTETTQPLNRYQDDWNKISWKVRELSKWKCCDCGKDFSNQKNRLHVHHIDGNKNNNSPSNLEAVCVECHSEKDFHGHMKKMTLFK